MNLKPSNQTKIYGLNNYLKDFIKLDNKKIYQVKFYFLVQKVLVNQHLHII